MSGRPGGGASGLAATWRGRAPSRTGHPCGAGAPRGRSAKIQTGRTPDLLRALAHEELDLVLGAWSGEPPVARATRVGRYDLQFWGRADRYPDLERATTEEAVQRFPIVEIRSLPGQPTMIREDAPSWAVAGSLASVKALVLAGFGVGALLDFMLEPAEREQLVRASVPHDPDCALWVAAGAHWSGEVAASIEASLVEALRDALPSGSEA